MRFLMTFGGMSACRSLARVLAGACLCALASACGMFGASIPALRIGDVRVAAAPDANQNSPLVLAVVVVSDAAVAQRLMNPEQKWFSAGTDLAATYPTAVHAYYCEFTPGQEMRLPRSLFAGQRAHAVFLFAVLGADERRARIDHWRTGGVVSFGREGWSAQAAPNGGDRTGGPPEMECGARNGARPS